MKKLICLLLLICIPVLGQAAKEKRRVVIVVIDQMRPDYIDRYNLPNLQALRQDAIEVKNAYTGHFPSLTIISHPAIATAAFPKNFGWVNEVWRDDEGLLGKQGTWYDTTTLSHEQYESILKKNLPQPTLLHQLKKELGGKVFVAGQKDYAALSFGGMDADRIVTLKKHSDGEFKGKCTPFGKNVPSYISKKDGRFWLDCTSKFGTENELYKLDSRYVPGDDAAHLGGDIWTTDAALELMQHEKDWRIMLITLGGVDRVGHVYGEMDHPEISKKIKSPYDLEKILHLADAQVARLIAELKAQGMWESTFFAVTADHGGISAQHYYGDKKVKDYNLNAKYGDFDFENFQQPAPALNKFIKTGFAEKISLDTAVHVWFSEKGKKNPAKACAAANLIPGAVAVYAKREQDAKYSYQRCALRKQIKLPSFIKVEEILNTSALPQAADLIVQLDDESGYQLIGDHGGLQEDALRIPMMLHGPNLTPGKNPCPARLVDILPTAFASFEIPIKGKTDGSAACIFHID